MRLITSLTLLSVLMLGSYTAFAKTDKPETTAIEDVIERVFGMKEKAIIKEYFGRKETRNVHHQKKGKSKEFPPGLAKKKTLPPGLAKHLEKNGVLPPGLAKRDLPEDLRNRLPESRKGTHRVIVDNDVVLIEKGTEIILDILKDIVE